MIEGHDLECRGKGSDLCRPVGAAVVKARREHDGWTCARNAMDSVPPSIVIISTVMLPIVWDGLTRTWTQRCFQTHTHLPETSPCVRIPSSEAPLRVQQTQEALEIFRVV